MLLWREKPPASWLEKVRTGLPAVLVDHAHLERKAATSALNLEKYVELHGHVSELNADRHRRTPALRTRARVSPRRGIPFTGPQRSPWICRDDERGAQRPAASGHRSSRGLRADRRALLREVPDPRGYLRADDPELADFYASLVESEGNHYATYLIMARHIDEPETDRRLDFFLDLDAELIRQPHPLPMLH